MSVFDFTKAYEQRHGKPLNAETPTVTRVDPFKVSYVRGKDPSDPMSEITELHIASGFVSRREYFYQLSLIHNVDVEVVQAAGITMETHNDFRKLVSYVEGISPNRNKSHES